MTSHRTCRCFVPQSSIFYFICVSINFSSPRRKELNESTCVKSFGLSLNADFEIPGSKVSQSGNHNYLHNK